MNIPFPTSSVAARFAWIIGAMCLALGKAHDRDRSTTSLVSMVYGRLLRIRARFAAIAARAEAGTLPAPRRFAGRRVVVRVVAPRAPRLVPSGFGWLGHLAMETRSHGASLQQLLLNDPEMVALVAAAPQVKRMLRALLWMTAVRAVPENVRRAVVARAPRVRAVPEVAPVVAVAKRRASHPVAASSSSGYRPSAKWPRAHWPRPPRPT